jgi:hypothetical protein
MIHEHPGSNCKSEDSTDTDIEKWFLGMLPNTLQTLAKVCHCPKEMLSK